MKRFALLFTFVACGFAQTLSMTCPAAPVALGTNVTIPLTLAGSGGGLVGIQGTVTVTPPVGAITAVTTGGAAAAGISAYVSTVNGISFLLGGFGPPPPSAPLNNAAIANGLVANVTLAIPSTLSGATSLQVSLAGGIVPLLGTGPSPGNIGITAGPACTIPIKTTNLCDLNGDGLVTQSDVQAQVALLFSQAANCARDANGCTVSAIDIVVNATGVNGTSGKCTATK